MENVHAYWCNNMCSSLYTCGCSCACNIRSSYYTGYNDIRNNNPSSKVSTDASKKGNIPSTTLSARQHNSDCR